MAVLAVIGLLAYGLLSEGEASLAVGDRAPDKELERLDGSGTRSLADYRGPLGPGQLLGLVVRALPRGGAGARSLPARARRAAGSPCSASTSTTRATTPSPSSREYGLTYPQLRDGDGRERRDAYGMTGFPESFLVDPDGEIALIRRGPVDSGAACARRSRR